MDIKYDELKAKVEEMSLEESGVINYRGRDYYVQPNSISFSEAGKDAGKPAEWHRSSAYSGGDIYIWGDRDNILKRTMILHEIIEADLAKWQSVPEEEAHEKASELDEKLAKEMGGEIGLKYYLRGKQYIQLFAELMCDAAA